MSNSPTNPGDLTTKVDMLEGQIQSLKEQVNQPSPWYKNIPIGVSVMALLFSFGTTYVSYQRTQAQDIHDRRAELRAILQRLAALPKDNFEVSQKYKADAGATAFLSGYLNQENALLARQGAEILSRLPQSSVSATEYYSIGLALQASYNIEGAQTLFNQAIKASNNLNDEVTALRVYANSLFLTGKIGEGRVAYQSALNVFSKYPGYDKFIQASTSVWTELSWAVSEANTGALTLAEQHVASAENNVSTLMASPGTEQLKAQIAHTQALLRSGAKLPTVPVGLR